MSFKLGAVAKKDPSFHPERRRPSKPQREHWFDRWIRSIKEDRARRDKPASCFSRGFHLWAVSGPAPHLRCKSCRRTPVEVLKDYPRNTMEHRWPKREREGHVQ